MSDSRQPAVIPGRDFLSRLGAAAIDAADSEELRLRKSLLMFASGLMNVAAIIWLAIYWWMGLKLPTSIPLGFQILSALVLVIYLRTRNFDFFRLAQLSLFLFFPFVIQWAIGSFVGVVESFAAYYISVPYKDAYAFLMLFLVLIFRPQGFFGERVSEKA